MSEYTHLIGAEDVRSAANSIRQSADDMQRAALSISDTLEVQRRYMDEWISRFEIAIKEMNQPLSPPPRSLHHVGSQDIESPQQT